MDTEIKHRYPILRKYGWTALAVTSLLAIALWGWSASRQSSYSTGSAAIIIEDVQQGMFEDYIRLSGKVETAIIVQISALETGIVESKPVEEGAYVEAGDIILTLRNPNLRQQILDSESKLAERQNMLRDTEIAMEKDRLQIKQDLLAAMTDYNRKRRAAEQQAALYDESLTSREEYLKAQEDCQLAKETLELLRSRQRQDSVYRSVQISMMRESLRNMQENFALVRQRADNLNIRASHAGQIVNLNAELGQNVAAGQQIAQVNIPDNYKISVSIDEHYIDRVSPGLKAEARRQNSTLGLTLKKVYPEVSQGVFRADFSIDSEIPANIRIGQTYPVDLILGEATEAVMVPRGTFYHTTGGKWAYVVDKEGNTATRREISIGRQNYRYYEVLEGLEPGERIITSSYSDFGDADKIIIKN